MMETPPFSGAHEHLLAELDRLDLLLHRQVRRLRAAHLLVEDPYRGLYISDDQVDALLLASRRGSPADSLPSPGGESARLSLELAALETSLAARRATSLAQGIALPFQTMIQRFGLDPLERDALLIAIAPDVDLKYETLFAYVQNDATRKRPTIDLALKLTSASYAASLCSRIAFAPEGRLFSQLLLYAVADSREPDAPLLAQTLRADARIVSDLLGEARFEPRLSGCARLLNPRVDAEELPIPHELQRVLHRLAETEGARDWIYVFEGPDACVGRSAAIALSRTWELPLLTVDIPLGLAESTPWPLLLGLARREAILRGAALLFTRAETLTLGDPGCASQRLQFARALADLRCPVFVATETSWAPDMAPGHARPICHLGLPPLEPRHRQAFWKKALAANAPESAATLNGNLGPLAERFQLEPEQIELAARGAALKAALRAEAPGSVAIEDLQRAAARQSGQALSQFGRKLPAVFTWNDLVLPPRAQQPLREICLSVKHRLRIREDWGFGRRLALGRGLNVLFAGPSGTGKTMAAQIIARDLGLDLYQIDLANVVSKYIGETEKNLGAIFRAAQRSNAILFFDEADALFGKRAEVKDAHDRYANLEVAYLLQKMEEYDGIVILATNLSKNIDEAFRRRLQHSVEFPFPEADLRERIWRGVFPAEAPLDPDIDFGFLARQFELSGGNIRNVGLAAAVFAAEDGNGSIPSPERHGIRMRHLIVATARELQKLGKLSSRNDFGPYYDLIRERV